MVGWLYVCAALTFPAAIFALLGWYIESTMRGEHIFAVSWWVWLLLGVVIVFFLTYFDVRISTRISMVLGSIEILIFLGLSFTMVFSRSSQLGAFDPSSAPSTGGLFQGAIFGVLAFTGFEVASNFGEEARNPRRTVKYAIVLSALIIGIFLIFATYASVVGTRSHLVDEFNSAGGDLWNRLGHEFWGAGWLLIVFALLNSIVANAIAAVNSGARLTYAMARVGAAPRYLTSVHRKHRTPSAAILSILAVAVVLGLASGIKFGAQTAFGVLATAFTVFVVCAYMICCAACISYFWRNHRAHRSRWLLHRIIPAAGIIAFALPLYSQYFDLTELFKGHFFVLAVPYPVNWADWSAVAWIAAGLIVVAVLAARKSPALSGVATAFTEASGEDALLGEPSPESV
jgi:amino acid transporter